MEDIESRISQISDSYKKGFLEVLNLDGVNGNVTQAILRLKRDKKPASRGHLYKSKLMDKEFSDLWEDIVQEHDDSLTDLIESKMVKLISEGNPKVVMFAAERRNPGRWGKRIEVTGDKEKPIQFESPSLMKLLKKGFEKEE